MEKVEVNDSVIVRCDGENYNKTYKIMPVYTHYETRFVNSSSGRPTSSIVGVETTSANPLEGSISENSPLGMALIGRRIGEKFKCVANKRQISGVIVNVLKEEKKLSKKLKDLKLKKMNI